MPPITSQEALTRPTPKEAIRQKAELITRAEQVAYSIEKTNIVPPVPGAPSRYYFFTMERANAAVTDIQLGIVAEDFVKGESHQMPLIQFHRSTEHIAEGSKSGVSTKSRREIRANTAMNGEADWVVIEPGTHLYDHVEDTITYIEKHLHRAKNSVVNRVAERVAGAIFGHTASS